MRIYPSGRSFSLSGSPKMLEGATREKFFLLLYKELTKKLLGQQAVNIRGPKKPLKSG